MGALVLVVEDHPGFRVAVRDALIDQGFAVVTAESAAAAHRLMLARGASFAFVVTDINLQDGTGWNVARAARSIWPRIQILYMSAENQADFEEQAVPHSAFVAKPFATHDLCCALSCLGLHSVLADSAPMAMAC
jgi:two-component system, cell cycle response regulator CpdR